MLSLDSKWRRQIVASQKKVDFQRRTGTRAIATKIGPKGNLLGTLGRQINPKLSEELTCTKPFYFSSPPDPLMHLSWAYTALFSTSVPSRDTLVHLSSISSTPPTSFLSPSEETMIITFSVFLLFAMFFQQDLIWSLTRFQRYYLNRRLSLLSLLDAIGLENCS